MPCPSPKRALTRVSPASLSYLLAAAIGVWAALDVFPLRDLLGRLPPGIPPTADLLQHIAGELYFLAEPWHWPLFEVHGLDAPRGVNIALTDSIPLAALLLKLLHPWLPGIQQAIGPWLGLAWVLQPVAAVYALRGTGERGLAPALAVAVMACAMPTFLVRLVHAALDGHFILLGALGLYLRATRPAAGRASVAVLSLLVVLTLFVHPYLMVQVAAIAVAVPATLAARAVWSPDRRLHRTASAGLFVLGGLATTAGLARLFGYLGGQNPNDYGVYAMNLVSPVWPAMSPLAPWADIKAIDVTGGQLFEGYQYLGAGLLLLLLALVARPIGRAWIAAGAHRHAGLLCACLLLTAYAVSTHVTLFHHNVLCLRMVPPLGRTFRASGRLFWPTAYVLLLAAVRGTSLAWPRARVVLLLAAAALQLYDSSALRTQDRYIETVAAQEEDVTEPALDDIMARVRSVTLLPRIECDGSNNTVAMPVIYLAARRNLPVNTMYAARIEAANRCDPARDAAVAIRLPPGALGVTFGPDRAAQAGSWRRHGMHCAEIEPYTLCSADAGTLADFAPTAPGTPLPPGKTITAVRRQLFADSLGSGWGAVESWGVWAIAPDPTLRLHVVSEAGTIRITLGLQAPAGVRRRAIAVRENSEAGRVVATATLGGWNQGVSFVLPPGEARADGGRVIALAIDGGSIAKFPGVPRWFGVGLVSVRVAPAAAAP